MTPAIPLETPTIARPGGYPRPAHVLALLRYSTVIFSLCLSFSLAHIHTHTLSLFSHTHTLSLSLSRSLVLSPLALALALALACSLSRARLRARALALSAHALVRGDTRTQTTMTCRPLSTASHARRSDTKLPHTNTRKHRNMRTHATLPRAHTSAQIKCAFPITINQYEWPLDTLMRHSRAHTQAQKHEMDAINGTRR